MRALSISILCFFMAIVIPLSKATAQVPPAPNTPKAVAWPSAPLACLPDRAKRWDESKDMPPCHCPPSDWCPSVAALTPDDITFYLDFRAVCGGTEYRRCSVSGSEIGAALQPLIDDGQVFTSYDAVARVIRDLVKQRCMGHDMLIKNEKCGNGHTKGGKAWADVTLNVAVESNRALEDWLNDTLRLPVGLATQCCDSICPAGLTPTIKEVTVKVDKWIGEGNGTPEACAKETEELNDLQDGMDALKTTYDDAKAAADDACNPPDGDPTSKACGDAIKDAEQARKDYKNAKSDLDAQASKKQDACDIPVKKTDTITVETVSCGMVKHFHREGCMMAGTPITMADGSIKTIETLQLGDMIKGNHGPAEVLALNTFTQKEDFMYSINGGEHFFTVEHPVLTKRGWKSVDATITSTKDTKTKILGTLTVGDSILTTDGAVEVKSIEKKAIQGGVSAYNLKVSGDGSFIANGIIMKGFEKVQMHY